MPAGEMPGVRTAAGSPESVLADLPPPIPRSAQSSVAFERGTVWAVSESARPAIGEKAPDASLFDVDGNAVRLWEFLPSGTAVLIFLRHYG